MQYFTTSLYWLYMLVTFGFASKSKQRLLYKHMDKMLDGLQRDIQRSDSALNQPRQGGKFAKKAGIR